MNSAILLVAKGASISFGPTGVTAATRRLRTGTRPRLTAVERVTRPSSRSPRTTKRPMATPTNHIPWVHAQTHGSGISHQRGLRSSMVISQAAVTTAAKTKEATCGLGPKLRLAPTRHIDVARDEAATLPRMRQLT